MKHLFFLCLLSSCLHANAQTQKYISLAAFNTQTSMPFSKFAGLFEETLHPGIEIGAGKNMVSKKKHEWFTELKLSYFYHRFVQHGIAFYLNAGYRYKFNRRFHAETSLGAGYLHSIPATAKFKLNDEGEYVNNKGLGRLQATAVYTLGVEFIPKPASAKSLKIFTSYQQRVQFPFVRSYVPLLPYTSFLIGIKKNIN